MNRPKGTGSLKVLPVPFGQVKVNTYLDLSAFFFSLVVFRLSFFRGIHPQPQSFLFFAIFFTSFLFKHLSNYLTKYAKKINYFRVDSISCTLCRTVLSSLSSSFSYCLSDSKPDFSNWMYLKFPVPWHPQVHTSVKTCRQFSIASWVSG